MKKDKEKKQTSVEKSETAVTEDAIIKEEANLEETNTELVEMQKKLETSEEMLKRVAAEYDNFKKRTQKEKENMYIDVKAETIASFLPVLDNLERGVLTSKNSNEAKAIVDGFEKILNGFIEVLTGIGVEKISVEDGFDPNMHNAVMHVDDENYGENQIAEEFMKGYKIKDKVIRHSMVKVAN